MSASLVGSEMCIRDSTPAVPVGSWLLLARLPRDGHPHTWTTSSLPAEAPTERARVATSGRKT
eukprot:4059790-Alexandrium_andersonii.AAC.1